MSFGLILLMMTTTTASWLGDRTGIHVNLIHSVDKAGQWVSKQTFGDTGSNANAAVGQAKLTAKAAEDAIKDVTPDTKATIISAKASLDGLAELVSLLKWPLFAITILGIACMAGVLLKVWSPLLKLCHRWHV